MKPIFHAAIFYGIAFSSVVAAQRTLSELIAASLSGHESVLIGQQKVKSLEKSNQSQLALDPAQIQLNSGYKSSSVSSDRGLHFGVQVLQPLKITGRYSKLEAMNDQSRGLVKMQATQDKLYLTGRVIAYAYKKALFDEMQAHSQERLRRLQLIEKHIARRPFLSPKRKAEKKIISARIRSLRLEFDELTIAAQAALKDLQMVTDFKDDDSLAITAWPKYDLRTMARIKFQLNNNSRIKNLQKQKTYLQARKNYFEASKYPDLSVGGYYNQEPAGGTESYAGAMVQVQFSFSTAKNNRAIESVEASEKALELQIQRSKKNLELELQSRINRVSLYYEKIQKWPDSENQEKEIEGLETDFRKGNIDVITFLEAENSIHESMHSFMQMKNAYISEFVYLAGMTSDIKFMKEVFHVK